MSNRRDWERGRVKLAEVHGYTKTGKRCSIIHSTPLVVSTVDGDFEEKEQISKQRRLAGVGHKVSDYMKPLYRS